MHESTSTGVALAAALVAGTAVVADAPPSTTQPGVVRATIDWTRLADVPDGIGVAGPYAGASGGALIVAGGANFPDGPPWTGHAKAWYDTAYVLPRPDGTWQTLPHALPSPRGYGATLTLPDGVLCIGGADQTHHYSDVFRLEWTDGQLRRHDLPALPQPLANLAAATVGRSVYVVGGIEQPASTVARPELLALDLDQAGATWRSLPPCPGSPRMLAVAAVSGETLYVAGGVSLAPDAAGKPSRTYLTDAYAYSTSSQKWTRLADLPRPAAAAPSPAMPIAGGFVIFGGDDGANINFEPKDKHPGFARDGLAYDIAANAWRAAGKVPLGQVTTALVPWDGGFVTPNGEIRPGVRTPQVWLATSSSGGAAR